MHNSRFYHLFARDGAKSTSPSSTCQRLPKRQKQPESPDEIFFCKSVPSGAAFALTLPNGSEYNAVALAKTDKRARTLGLDAAESRRPAEGHSAQPAVHQRPPALGVDLRAARENKNLTLNQISEETHISLRHLQSLEEGKYSNLPGGMYNRAFLRSYCTYLELDPAGFLARYEVEVGAHAEKPVKSKQRSPAVVSQPKRIPPLLIWSVMLLGSITGLYFSRGWIAQVFSPYFSQPPITRLPAAMPAPTPSPDKPKDAQAVPSTPPAGDVTTEPPPAESSAKEPAAAAAATDEPPPGTIRLNFEVTGACWMSLKSDGTSVYSDTLQPGTSPSFDAKDHFEMVLGNAGAVKLKINGKQAKPLGSPGAVVKIVINAANIPDLLEKMIE